jgi:hypothetical protein
LLIVIARRLSVKLSMHLIFFLSQEKRDAGSFVLG